MSGMDWTKKRCVPCEGGVPRLERARVEEWLHTVDGWSHGDDRLLKRFRFRDFNAAMRFVNAMAALAEDEGHHPDFSVQYATVDVKLWTHAAGGLTENDFILAAKIDALPKDPAPR
jgi:4a-hydroxytetrahydrobiopterin dehydratase